jgi:hypothetical protein
MVLGAVGRALIPWMLDLPAVRATLERRVSDAVGGSVAYDALELRLLPSPHGAVRGVRIEVPGIVSGRAEEIHAHLRLWPLLAGRVEVQGVTIVRPVLRVTVPGPAAEKPRRLTDLLVAYRNVMQRLVDGVRRTAPEVSLGIRDAEIEVLVPGLRPIGQVGFNAQGRSDARGMELTASATGSLWQNVRAKARLEYADLAARVEIDGVGFRPQPLLDHLQGGAAVTVGIELGDTHAEAHTDGRTTIGATLRADVPALVVVREEARVELEALHAEAAFEASGPSAAFTVKAVRQVDHTALATLRVARAAQAQVEASIEVPALDLARLRDVVTTLASDREWVRRYVARLRAGRVTGLQVDARAPSLGALFDTATIDVRATVKDGAVVVPAIEQEATDVSAALAWSKGGLSARSVSGRIGQTRIADGSADYRVGDGRISADLGFDLDLVQALDLARRLAPPEQVPGLDMIRRASGRAQGRLTYAGTSARWQADCTVARSDSVLGLREVPWPVRMREGKLSVSPGRLTVADAGGAVGASTFSQAGVALIIGTPTRFDAARGAATLALAEIYPWLRARLGLRARLHDLTAVTGSLDVTVHRATGRLDQLGATLYDVTLRPRRVRAALSDLPAPLLVDAGSIGVTPQALRLDGVMPALLDARVRVSGTVRGYRTDAAQVEASLADGESGEAFLTWAWTRAGAPARLRPRAPLRFAAERVRWRRETGIDLRAAAQIVDGPSVEAEVAWKRGTLDVRRAHIKDKESDATLSLVTRGRLLDIGFSGVLTGRSVAGLFAVSAGERTGRVEGDMRAIIDRELRGRTTAEGRLTGEQIRLERLLGVPLEVERIDLDADGARLRVNEASIGWAQQRATLRGEVRHGESGPVIDAQLDTPGIVIDPLLPTVRGAGPGAPQEPVLPEAFDVWPLPASGKLAVRAGFLQYRRLRMDGVEAKVILEPERARLKVTKGVYCDIAFPLSVELTPRGAAAAVQPRARGQRVEAVASCLTEGRTRLTGALDLRADLTTSGAPGELLDRLQGTVELRTREGRVLKWGLLGNILALKSISSLLIKGGPRLDETGFAYREIQLRGRVGDGRLIVDEGAFDSAALGLVANGTIRLETRDADLTVLVAPFSRADQIVRRVPIVGYVLGGTFTSVPVSVTGNIFDPVVVPLGPKAVTTELAGIFERTLKLPGKLVQPVEPDKTAR